ncbi:MAG: dihydrolipoamide acetyltransferase family protein [SAR324 cluster bacterium]|nr:dihydrolipoamide acetyltransferase family protein [SAR324 cluster bacterium]
MAFEMRMPQLGDEMVEGIISRWLKQQGDAVQKGEPIVEVETEKVIVEVEAEADGVIVEIAAREQDVVPVGGLICLIGEAGEVAEAPSAPAAEPPAAPPAEPEPPPAPKQTDLPAAGSPPRAQPQARPQVTPQVPLAAAAFPPAPGGGGAASNVVPLVQPAAAVAGSGAQVEATPLARRIAEELEIDLAAVKGSGIGGKIVKTDLQPYLDNLAIQPSSPQPEAAAPLARVPSIPVPEGAVEVPHTPLRRAVARRMARSKAEIPHFYMTAEVDVTEMLQLRRRLNEKAAEPKVTVNDVMIKAAALTLARVPDFNTSFTEAAILRHEAIHVAFAVAIEGGLVTPVVRDCQLKSVGRIAADTAELVERAKDRKLRPEELEGGTFTISNMGMYDVVEFAAIINPPQVGILAVARPVEMPVVDGGRMVVRSRMRVTISADHRAVDGVTAAAFLREFKGILEDPMRLML